MALAAAQESEAVLAARLRDAIFRYAALRPLDEVRDVATATIDNLEQENA